jgi:hypothetical protein
MRIKTAWGVKLSDDREICDLLTKAGRDEYARRLRAMWLRQKKRCCLEGYIAGCPGYLKIAEATFEHQDGRGMNGGHRDDRAEKLDKKSGAMKPYNGVAHWQCNREKGSKKIDYTHFYDA